ncbi:NAD(P)-binding domain-containing protein [Streptomyces javensis]|uniref:NAD(P)-binding domain-containing protein n=1 Tax=Streptomyces javensis TaxID=114698 RepID=UPI0033FEFBFB
MCSAPSTRARPCATTSVWPTPASGHTTRGPRHDPVDASMSDGDAGARAGTLSLMVGAAPEAYRHVEPVLRSFAGFAGGPREVTFTCVPPPPSTPRGRTVRSSPRSSRARCCGTWW